MDLRQRLPKVPRNPSHPEHPRLPHLPLMKMKKKRKKKILIRMKKKREKKQKRGKKEKGRKSPGPRNHAKHVATPVNQSVILANRESISPILYVCKRENQTHQLSLECLLLSIDFYLTNGKNLGKMRFYV